MKRRPVEETLLALRRVRQAPEEEASRRELRAVLEGEASHAVARAATLVGELGLEPFVPELVAAFPRFGLRGAAALLALAKEEPLPLAREALSALASVGSADPLYERAEAVAEARPELKEALARGFGRGARGERVRS